MRTSTATSSRDVGALLGDEVVVGEPGDLIFKPRDQWHTFWNAGDEPARLLEIISPAGFEKYFDEITELPREDGRPDPAALAELAGRYAWRRSRRHPPPPGGARARPSPSPRARAPGRAPARPSPDGGRARGGPCGRLKAQLVGVVAEVAAQRVAVDDDPVGDVGARRGAAVVQAAAAPARLSPSEMTTATLLSSARWAQSGSSSSASTPAPRIRRRRRDRARGTRSRPARPRGRPGPGAQALDDALEPARRPGRASRPGAWPGRRSARTGPARRPRRPPRPAPAAPGTRR